MTNKEAIERLKNLYDRAGNPKPGDFAAVCIAIEAIEKSETAVQTLDGAKVIWDAPECYATEDYITCKICGERNYKQYLRYKENGRLYCSNCGFNWKGENVRDDIYKMEVES